MISRNLLYTIGLFFLGGGFLIAFNNFSFPHSEVYIRQPGEIGIFDPSVESYAGISWMTYSSATSAGVAGISTRLAVSNNGGTSWYDLNRVVFGAESVPMPPPFDMGTWVYESSSLVNDESAPTIERWKVFVHRYMIIKGTQYFSLGWIGYKSGPSPLGPWSAEKKFLVGSIYERQLDPILGPSELNQDTLGDGRLSDCLAFSEPGAYSDGKNLYLTLVCGTMNGSNNRLILLKRSGLPGSSANSAAGSWGYQADLLGSSDAKAVNAESMSAGDIFRTKSGVYLVASPELKGTYHGCLVYKFSDLAKGLLETDSRGAKRLYNLVAMSPGANLTGSCTHDESLTRSGMLYMTRTPETPFRAFTHIFQSYLSF